MELLLQRNRKMRFCGCDISVHNAHNRNPLPCRDANKPPDHKLGHEGGWMEFG